MEGRPDADMGKDMAEDDERTGKGGGGVAVNDADIQ